MYILKYRRLYVFFDFLAAAISWIIFCFFRKYVVEATYIDKKLINSIDFKFYISIVLISAFWYLLYYSSGYYNNVLRKTRLEDFGRTFLVTLLGLVIIFFFILLDDYVEKYVQYYELFLVLFTTHFLFTLIPRLFITSHILNQEQNGKIEFQTILIGRVDKIRQIWKEMDYRFKGHGYKALGYIPIDGETNNLNDLNITQIANFHNIHDTIKQQPVTDVIIALNHSDIDLYEQIIYELNSSNIVVKINPELYSVAKRQIVISSLFHYPLIQISRELLPPWQASIKLLIDIFAALIGIIMSIPICICLAIIIKSTSKGPIFYSHERIGRYGKPFRIYKFRSMYHDAEKNGPSLETENDPRVTPIGRIMRRTKLDEIPNFINVLKGDMSLVGPRPERQFYIDQIVKKAPEYSKLLKIKPGVTSWGQVKYGYASNVDEMLRRMRYDLLYLENMSLYVDFQILARTILTIFKG